MASFGTIVDQQVSDLQTVQSGLAGLLAAAVQTSTDLATASQGFVQASQDLADSFSALADTVKTSSASAVAAATSTSTSTKLGGASTPSLASQSSDLQLKQSAVDAAAIAYAQAKRQSDAAQSAFAAALQFFINTEEQVTADLSFAVSALSG